MQLNYEMISSDSVSSYWRDRKQPVEEIIFLPHLDCSLPNLDQAYSLP